MKRAHGNRFEFSEETRMRQELVLVALGKRPADLIIRGATVLDVFTLLWKENQDIVVKGNRIAWVGEAGAWPGEAGDIVAAEEEWAVPGFGESHKHIESGYVSPEFEAELVIPGGNTWTAEGSHEMCNVVGEHSVDFWLIAAAHGSPLKIYVAVGSATPPTVYEHTAGYYGYDEMREFLSRDARVAGLGEVMDWTSVWDPEAPGYQRLWEVMQATADSRAVLEGHGMGLDDSNRVSAFAAAGLSSDHHIKTGEECLLKLRSGLFIELPRHSLATVLPYLLGNGVQDWSNVSICTDDRDALEALRDGTMDYNIRTAIEAGVSVEVAYAMASYYPARHWHLEHQVGSITPGRYADIVLMKDLEKVSVGRVFVNGRLAAEDGEYLLDIPRIEYPDWVRKSIHVGRRLNAEDFAIQAPVGRSKVKAALLEFWHFEEEFLTETMEVRDGQVGPDMKRGISKVAVVDRYHGDAQVSRMFWRGVGPRDSDSALTSSVCHDTHNIWVVGNSDAAMALAVNAVVEMGGGWALVRNGVIVAKIRLEIGGLMSQRPAREVAADIEKFYATADEMEWIGYQPGTTRVDMSKAFLTCTPWKWVLVAPCKEASDGFVNVTNGQTHPVVW